MTLKEYTETYGIKQSFLAERTGTSRTYFNLILNGKRTPPVWFILAVRKETKGQVGFDDWFPPEQDVPDRSRAA